MRARGNLISPFVSIGIDFAVACGAIREEESMGPAGKGRG